MDPNAKRRLLAAVGLASFAVAVRAEIDVTTTNDADNGSDGVCSLREAILAVNAGMAHNECTDTAGTNTGQFDFIAFNIPGDGVHTIALQSPVPAVAKRILVDATPQGTCTPIPHVGVEITNGNALASDALVLLPGTDYSTIGGLGISGFASGAGISSYSNFNLIACNVIGTDPTGTIAQPNHDGVVVFGSNNSVGAATEGSWLPNLISGNSNANILVTNNAANTVIAGNFIGVDHTGLIPFASIYGVYDQQATGTRIGTGTGGGPPQHQRNVIGVTWPGSGVSYDVLLEQSTNAVVAGNYVGVGTDGQTLLPLGLGIAVELTQASGALIGCDGNSSWDSCRNVIANSGFAGVGVGKTSSGSAIVSNFIDVAADGVTLLANALGTSGISAIGNVLVARNLISSGSGYGILLSSNSTDPTPIFLNAAAAGTGGAILDSSDNCLQHNSIAGVYALNSGGGSVAATTFVDNWWGAADGPSGNNGGSGVFASASVTVAPVLAAPSVYCGFDHIFGDGFD